MAWQTADTIPMTDGEFLVFCEINKAVYQAHWANEFSGEIAFDELTSVPDGVLLKAKYWMEIPEIPE